MLYLETSGTMDIVLTTADLHIWTDYILQYVPAVSLLLSSSNYSFTSEKSFSSPQEPNSGFDGPLSSSKCSTLLVVVQG